MLGKPIWFEKTTTTTTTTKTLTNNKSTGIFFELFGAVLRRLGIVKTSTTETHIL